MDLNKRVFESTPLEVVQYFMTRCLTNLVIMLTIMFSFSFYLQKSIPYMPPLISEATIIGVVFGLLFVFTYALIFSCTCVAYRIEIKNEGMDFSTISNEHQKLTWKQIAGVRHDYNLFQKSTYIVTKNGRYLLISPTLDSPALIADEIRKYVKDDRVATFKALAIVQLRYGLIAILSIACLAGCYLLWQNLRDPALELQSWLDKGKLIKAVVGKQSFIHEYRLQNFGRTTKGLRLELSGKAVAENFITDPSVILNSEDKTRFEHPNLVSNQSRKVIHFSKTKSDTWRAEAENAELKHKYDIFSESVITLPTLLSDMDKVMTHELTLQLFADTRKEGNANLNLEISCLGSPNCKTQTENMLVVSKGGKGNKLDPLPSEGMPANFPIKAFPNSSILILSRYQVRLDAIADVDSVFSYYKSELRSKGWHVLAYPEDPIFKHGIEATKGKESIAIDGRQSANHAVVEILYGD